MCKERKDNKECHLYLYNDNNEMQIFQGTFLQCIFHTISIYTIFGFFSGSITMDKFTDGASRVCSGFMWFWILMCLSWPSAFPAALLYVLALPFLGQYVTTYSVLCSFLWDVQTICLHWHHSVTQDVMGSVKTTYILLIAKMAYALNAFLLSNDNRQEKT